MNPTGLLLIVASLLLPAFAIWPLTDIHPNGALLAQYFGVASIITMAWAQIIATRWRGIEPLFGAMDRAYVIHKWLGISALAMMHLHDTIDPEIKDLTPKLGLQTSVKKWERSA